MPTGTPVPPPAAPVEPGFAAETYYAPGWQPAAPRVEPLAVAAVPAGVVLGPVGIGLGAAGLSRVRSRGTRGRGLAVAGMVVGAVVTVAWAVGALLWWQGAQARAPLAGDVAAPQTVNAVQLVLGTCLDELPPDGEVSQVRAVPCADEHRAQVVARTDLGADEVWPGQQAVDRRVARVCTPDVLGSDAPEGVDLVVWSPTEASWRDGDRTGLCLAAAADPLPGDLLG
ncbi:septum formation family protein [Cellulosimicrobium cellulans]|uniref:septum formation family protein n=1 Tax=Cellulosimicrobium cellulans TaxID=1710 RepID=UPI001FCC5CA9|nr:septum formation family protein [Cellulosimicrobium cellulans]